MIEKPSENEETYFARVEFERRRKAAEERLAAVQVEEREKARALHYMKCPKCGMQLEDVTYSDVKVDKCFGCEGVWLDRGEIDIIRKKDAGFVGTLLNAFR
jgi:hypothetical protein